MDFYIVALVAAVAFGASLVQNVTGFGFGIVAMMFLPNLLVYTEANVLSSMLGTVTSTLVVFSMYRKVDWKNLIFPLIGSVVANYFAINFVKGAENKLLILLLGIALLALSVYFFFFSDRIKIKPSWYVGLTVGVISGVMSGLFSIGGPPVVIYFLQSEETTDRYLATISMYFVLSGIISISMKAASGFITVNVLLGLALGLLGMLIGSFLGKRIRGRANPKLIRKSVYAVMAVSGVIHIVSSLM